MFWPLSGRRLGYVFSSPAGPPECGRLAGPVGAEESQDFSLSDLEFDPEEDLNVTVAEVDPTQREGRNVAGMASCRVCSSISSRISTTTKIDHSLMK